MESQETAKQRSDRQLAELLNELRVVLPGAQILLGFLLTVTFATRFGRVTHAERDLFLGCLLCTAAGTVLLMAPSVYHRVRWEQGGKSDTIRSAHRFFLAGTALLGAGMVAAVLLVSDVLVGPIAAIASTVLVGGVLAGSWYVVPLRRARLPQVRDQE